MLSPLKQRVNPKTEIGFESIDERNNQTPEHNLSKMVGNEPKRMCMIELPNKAVKIPPRNVHKPPIVANPFGIDFSLES
jgi:hypothetical protein